jgi:transposase
MEEKLFSVKDLSVRWQKDEGTIRRYVKDGILTPCKGVPGMMFHPKYIAELEGIELERFSPLEKRRFENEITKLIKENEVLKTTLREYQVISAKSLSLLA